jgi:hypothetical protein
METKENKISPKVSSYIQNIQEVKMPSIRFFLIKLQKDISSINITIHEMW